MKNTGKFSSSLLHPRYWFTWFGLGVLWLLVQLPYPVLMRLGAVPAKSLAISCSAASVLPVVTSNSAFRASAKKKQNI